MKTPASRSGRRYGALAAAVTEMHGASAPVAAYTGQLDPAERERLEDALRANQLKALVATSALGMGYDKPDLGFVVHVGAPSSPIAYYQQVGRAGRAAEASGGRATAVLLPGPRVATRPRDLSPHSSQA